MKKIWKIEKLVLPQHSDHSGVMWHGTYFDWLEEGRINALSKAGINYVDLTKNGFELPLYRYFNKIYITLISWRYYKNRNYIWNKQKSKNKNPFKIYNKSKTVLTIAEVNLVLINKKSFFIIRERPDFILKAFLKLNG